MLFSVASEPSRLDEWLGMDLSNALIAMQLFQMLTRRLHRGDTPRPASVQGRVRLCLYSRPRGTIEPHDAMPSLRSEAGVTLARSA